MQAGARHLARGIQTGHARASVHSGHHAAAGEMRGRGHRNRVHRGVQPQRRTRPVDGREPRGEAGNAGRVKEDVIVDATGSQRHPARDRRRNDVAGREIAERVHASHHRRARRVEQRRALAAHGLGDQRAPAPRARRVQHGRVELHELDVRHRRPGPQRQGEPVPGGDFGIRRRLVQLPEPAAGQQHGRRAHGAGHAVVIEHGHAGHPATGCAQRVDRDVVLQHRNPPVSRASDQRPLDLGAGGVAARVDDAERAVPALPRPCQQAARTRVEPSTARPQVRDRGGATVEDRAHGVFVAKPGACGERVLGVLRHRVVEVVLAGQHDGDAALRPARVAVRDGRLRHDQDVQPEFLGPQCGGQPGDPAADHDQVRTSFPDRGFRS